MCVRKKESSLLTSGEETATLGNNSTLRTPLELFEDNEERWQQPIDGAFEHSRTVLAHPVQASPVQRPVARGAHRRQTSDPQPAMLSELSSLEKTEGPKVHMPILLWGTTFERKLAADHRLMSSSRAMAHSPSRTFALEERMDCAASQVPAPISMRVPRDVDAKRGGRRTRGAKAFSTFPSSSELKGRRLHAAEQPHRRDAYFGSRTP